MIEEGRQDSLASVCMPMSTYTHTHTTQTLRPHQSDPCGRCLWGYTPALEPKVVSSFPPAPQPTLSMDLTGGQ